MPTSSVRGRRGQSQHRAPRATTSSVGAAQGTGQVGRQLCTAQEFHQNLCFLCTDKTAGAVMGLEEERLHTSVGFGAPCAAQG